MVNQEPNQETLFLVGSWLRPEDFGFGHPLPPPKKINISNPFPQISQNSTGEAQAESYSILGGFLCKCP